MALATRTDSTELLSKISVPTLVVVGEQDKVTPLSEAEILKKNISGSQLKVIPRVGHLSNLEDPRGFNEALVVFLDQFKAKKN